MKRLDHFMAAANQAYYARHDPFADFTTAPEISQVFGEVLGAWAVVTWQALGAPDPVYLAELGPGRGTLMADAMRLIRRLAPGFAAALRLHLVETSPRLRAAQAGAIGGPITWHDDLTTLPDGPLILLANEFLDALPIRQFERDAEGWRERYVDQGAFVLLPAVADLPDDPPGSIRERSEPAFAIAAWLGARLARAPGAALFLDYGPSASGPGDSLQALRDGKPADPLAAPGEADLTAHVDFAAFAAAARDAGAVPHGPLAQGRFLTRLGLFQRSDRLARGRDAATAVALMDAASRLTEPTRMGGLFKALALVSPGAPTPAGFEP